MPQGLRLRATVGLEGREVAGQPRLIMAEQGDGARLVLQRLLSSKLFTVYNRTAVRFSYFQNPTVRWGAVRILVFESTVRCDAVLYGLLVLSVLL